MPHKPWKLLSSFWAMSLALAIVTLFHVGGGQQRARDPTAAFASSSALVS